MRVELHHPELGPVEMPGVSLAMSASPPRVPNLMATLAEPSSVTRSSAPEPLTRVPHDAPLAGVRVLDLGVVIAGAYAATMLAGLGADVVKIETPSGDPFRSYGAAFCSYNRGKRSLVLDLKRPEAKELFFELVAQADVVLDNSRLGVRERLGITYESLRAVNPRIISISISGYGRSGPQASLPGFDPLLQAQSGLMQAQGGEHSEPVFHHVAVNDVGSAAMAALGVVAALVARTRTGLGQELHTSLAAQSVLLQIGELTTYPGAPRPATGARDCIGASALERYYECVDGWIAVACTTVEHSRALLDAVAIADVDPRSALDEARDGALAARLAGALLPMSVDGAITKLDELGVPAVPALTLDETYTDSFLHENGFWESYDDPASGSAEGPASSARFARTPAGYGRAAPRLGEHGVEILRELGVPQARIDAILAAD